MMSVISCPVCQGAMRETERDGVLIDTCTQCRGVWLDRGELEKLAGAFDGQTVPRFSAAAPQQRHRDHRHDMNGTDDDDDRFGSGRQTPSRLSRLMDFFD